jgi:hypothetical protein
MFQLIEKKRTQIRAFAILSLGVLALTATACINHTALFERFVDLLHPELVVYFCSLAGLLAILQLMKAAPFYILGKRPQKGILWSLLLAIPFGGLIILIDILAPFPEDIALPFPASLLIYPAMGFVAEIIFHILPFTILVIVMSKLFRKVRIEKIIGFGILITAFIESTYHMVNLSGSVQFSNWILLLVGFHILLFSLCQLIVFRRYDFISMYTLRLTYYLIWHVAWGTFRLNLIF